MAKLADRPLIKKVANVSPEHLVGISSSLDIHCSDWFGSILIASAVRLVSMERECR